MFNKKLLASLAVASSIGIGSMVSAMAQPMGPGEPPPPPSGAFGPAVGPLGYIFENLNLSAEQRAKARVIVDQARVKEESTRQETEVELHKMANTLLSPGKVTKGNLDPYMEKLAKIHEEKLKNHEESVLALRNILTPEQLVQLKARLIKMKDIHSQMMQLRGQMHQTATTGTAVPAVVPGSVRNNQ